MKESVRQVLVEAVTEDGEYYTYFVPVVAFTEVERRSRFEHELVKRHENREAGLCPCGRVRSRGYRTCTACRCKARLRKRRQREPERKVRQAHSLLPKQFRQIHKGDLSAALWRYQSERKTRGACVPPRPQPLAFDALPERRQRFVAKYVTNGRNGQRAALYAGYGAGSASRGGRAAAVRASRLLRDPEVKRAIEEAEHYLLIRREHERQQESQTKRAEIASMIEARLVPGERGGPHSRSAVRARRWRGEPVRREPGRCRCGAVPDPGYASCEKCRRAHREYRREWRSDPWRAEWEREQSRRRHAERARPVWDPARDRERRRMEFDREWPEVPEVDAILEDPIVVQTVQERYWQRIARNFDAAWFG